MYEKNSCDSRAPKALLFMFAEGGFRGMVMPDSKKAGMMINYSEEIRNFVADFIGKTKRWIDCPKTR